MKLQDIISHYLTGQVGPTRTRETIVTSWIRASYYVEASEQPTVK